MGKNRTFIQAGLENKSSFANLEELPNYTIEEIRKFKKIGHLTDRDIDRLIEALERYYL